MHYYAMYVFQRILLILLNNDRITQSRRHALASITSIILL